VKAGESLFHPSRIEHAWRNEGRIPVRLLWVATPPTF
jgi:mannose-6-phosphate isomerase-like protein (cupin superfamily)